MHTEIEDWKNGWYGVQVGFTASEIDALIERLRMLKADTDQHFHLTSTYRGTGGVGSITIYVQPSSEQDNMEAVGSRVFAPGEDLPVSED